MVVAIELDGASSVGNPIICNSVNIPEVELPLTSTGAAKCFMFSTMRQAYTIGE